MSLQERIAGQFSRSIETKRVALAQMAPSIEGAVHAMVECLRGDGKIMACGNGGSSAGAHHFAA